MITTDKNKWFRYYKGLVCRNGVTNLNTAINNKGKIEQEELKPGKKHPVMYKGYIIQKRIIQGKTKLCAYSYASDIFLNPLYDNWNSLKLVIDNLKD